MMDILSYYWDISWLPIHRIMDQEKRYPTAMTIAGSDSGGGAGIQADLKTFAALGVFGTSVITSVTAQNTKEVQAVEVLSTHIVRLQLETVLQDIRIDVVKTGMLPSVEIVETVAEIVDVYNLQTVIVDPVMVSTSGCALVQNPVLPTFRELLFRRLTLITPNIPEAELLSGITIQNEKHIYRAGEELLRQGCRGVLIKGGHWKGDSSSDILFTGNNEPIVYSSPFIQSDNLHGTGCTLASAIAAYMALGYTLPEAVTLAKQYITSAISAAAGVYTGKGSGPVNHFFNPQSLKPV